MLLLMLILFVVQNDIFVLISPQENVIYNNSEEFIQILFKLATSEWMQVNSYDMRNL